VNRAELIALLQQRQPHLPPQAVETAVKDLLTLMAETLTMGDRIEIRGFGSFAVRWRETRIARNLRTGALVEVAAHYVPRFKPGKELREGVNDQVSTTA
jgi:integration host factor subunit beta